MLQKRPSDREDHVVVTFLVSSDGHDLPVHLAGDLNGWDASSLVLQQVSDDQLALTMTLPRGRRYEFRYCDARGRWFNDEAPDGYCGNQWGGMNGVLQT